MLSSACGNSRLCPLTPCCARSTNSVSEKKNCCLFLRSLCFCGARLEKNKINKYSYYSRTTNVQSRSTKKTKRKMKGFTSPSCIIYRAARWEKTGMFWLKIPHRCCSLRRSLEFVACGHWGRTSGTIMTQEPEPVQTCEEAATVPCSGKQPPAEGEMLPAP